MDFLKDLFNPKGRWNIKKFWLYPLTFLPLIIIGFWLMTVQNPTVAMLWNGIFIVSYILAVISTMYPSKIDEKGKMFIDNKTKQCFNLIDKGTVPKIMMIKHINKVRKIMHLKPI